LARNDPRQGARSACVYVRTSGEWTIDETDL
jgi:hypothetical protein